MSSFASIYAAAKKFTAESERLDTLILNAGVMDPAPHTTEQGHEIHIGTNHIGHFLLTKLLLPTLLKTASGRTSAGQPSDVRVITVASMAWQMSPPLSNLLSTEALLASHSYARYGASKAAIIAFASELARRYPQLTSVSLHPGVIFTGLYDSSRAMSGALRIAINAAKPFTIDEKQGSLNHLWAAGSEKEKLTSGEYYTPVGVGGWKNVWADDEEVGRKLWEWSEEEVSEHQKD